MPYPDRLDLTIYMDLRDSEDVLDFSGVAGDYFILNPATFPITAFTYECWAETGDTGLAGTLVSYAVAGDFDHILIQDYRNLEIIINGVSSGSTGVAINNEVPHHIAVSWQASDGETKLYVDAKLRWSGTLATSNLTSGGALVAGLEQGSVGGTFSNAFLGKQWDFRIWSDVRTEAEILDNMNLRLTGADAGLSIYYTLDEGTGTTLTDDVGSQDATLSDSGMWTTTETPFWSDVAGDVDPESLSISAALGDAVNTLYQSIDGWTGTEPQEWDEIVVFDMGTRIFGGFVTSLNRSEGDGATVKHALGCSDYAIYLDHIIHKENWEDKTDKQIIEDLIQTYVPWIGTDNVLAIKTYENIRMNRQTIRKFINQLAVAAQADWYISADRELYFFQAQTADADFDLSDDPDYATEYPFYGLVKHEGGSDMANIIEVVGGDYLATEQYFYLEGAGKDPIIQMPFRMHKPDGESAIQVWRNDGSEGTPSWTAMTVKVGHIDALGGANEVLHYFQEQNLEQQGDWPALPNAVRVYARYEIPLITRVRDQESFNYYKKWFYDYINDPDITDKTTARLVAKGELAERSMGKTSVTIHVAQPGLRVGEKIHLKTTQFGIDDDFVIKRINATVRTYGRVRYGLSLGVWSDDLIDILLELWNKKDDTPLWRDDEVLDELLETLEDLFFDETTPVPVATIGPYVWGPEGSGNTPAKWDYGSWG